MFTKCTACGAKGEFEVVIPSKDLNVFDDSLTEIDGGYHVVLSKDKKTVVCVEDGTLIEDWVTDDEATAFKTGTKHAECPTCGAELEDITGTEPYDYDAVLGTWTYTYVGDPKEPTTSKNYYLTVSRENGYYNVDAYCAEYTTGAIDLTSSVKLTVESVDGFVSGSSVTALGAAYEKENLFVFTIDREDYFLTQYAKDDDTDAKAYAKGDLAFGILSDSNLDGSTQITLTPVKVSAPTDHTHNFVLMSDARAVTEDKDSNKGHYLECSCGLKYVFAKHAAGCDTCKYASDWQKITVTDSSKTETYYAPKDTVLRLQTGTTSGTTYTYFDGNSVKYTKFSVTNAKETSGTTYTWNGTGEGLVVTLTPVVG